MLLPFFGKYRLVSVLAPRPMPPRCTSKKWSRLGDGFPFGEKLKNINFYFEIAKCQSL